MLIDLFLQHWISFHGLVTLLALAVYLTASHFLRQRRHPSAAIAWFLSLALMPYVALPLYLLFGNRKVARPNATSRVIPTLSANREDSQAMTRIQILAGTLGLPEPSSYDCFTLHQDGRHALQSLISIIDSASDSLDLCTFVFGRDSLGQEVGQHLMLSATKGVRVRLMIDGIGRYLGGFPDFRALKAAGVHVCLFVSPFRSGFPGRTNLRNHRKMAIADGQRLWMGGRNLAAEYFEDSHADELKKPRWIDLSFELEGAIANQAREQFNQDWAFATQQEDGPNKALHSSPVTWKRSSSAAQLVPSGPDQTEDTLYTLLISCCFAAQSRILAVSPYFVPDATLQMALTLAARRGVAVDLVIPGKSNHRLADLARHAALRELSSSGARVWLAPWMNHAKAIVIDDEVALAGSANLDERSLFLNYELMVAFYQPSAIKQFAQWIERQRDDARIYTARPAGILREFREGIVRWLAFQI